MPNLVNRLVLREIGAACASEGLILLSYGGLDAVENETLRDRLAQKGCELRMVRNALANRVLSERGFELPAGVLSGNVAVAFGKAEAVLHAAKVITSAEVKKAGKVTARAGVLEGRLLSAADVVALADVPDRATLQAQLLGLISGPARGLVRAMNGMPGGMARVLQARADKLAGQPAEQTGSSAAEGAAS